MHWFLFLSPTYFYGDIDAIAGFLACKASGFRLSADNLLCRRAPRRRRQVYIVHFGLRFLCVAAQSPAPLPGTAPPITHVAFHSEPGTKGEAQREAATLECHAVPDDRSGILATDLQLSTEHRQSGKGEGRCGESTGKGKALLLQSPPRLASTATNVLAEYLPTAAHPRRDCGLRIAGACYDIIDPTTTTTSAPSSSPSSSSSSSSRTLDFGGLCARLGACGATAGCARSSRLVRVLARKPLSGSGIRRRHPPRVPEAGVRNLQEDLLQTHRAGTEKAEE